MWKCESGCLVGDERETLGARAKRDGASGGPDAPPAVVVKEITWRPRQANWVRLVGKAQTSVDAAICSKCQNDWDDYCITHPTWLKILETDKKRIRMEVQGYGVTLDAGWEALVDETYKLAVEMRAVGKAWLEARRAEIKKENEGRIIPSWMV